MAGFLLATSCSLPSGNGPVDGDQIRALGAPGRAAGYNLLLITLDTVRADRLGCYGGTIAPGGLHDQPDLSG